MRVILIISLVLMSFLSTGAELPTRPELVTAQQEADNGGYRMPEGAGVLGNSTFEDLIWVKTGNISTKGTVYEMGIRVKTAYVEGQTYGTHVWFRLIEYGSDVAYIDRISLGVKLSWEGGSITYNQSEHWDLDFSRETSFRPTIVFPENIDSKFVTISLIALFWVNHLRGRLDPRDYYNEGPYVDIFRTRLYDGSERAGSMIVSDEVNGSVIEVEQGSNRNITLRIFDELYVVVEFYIDGEFQDREYWLDPDDSYFDYVTPLSGYELGEYELEWRAEITLRFSTLFKLTVRIVEPTESTLPYPFVPLLLLPVLVIGRRQERHIQ